MISEGLKISFRQHELLGNIKYSSEDDKRSKETLEGDYRQEAWLILFLQYLFFGKVRERGWWWGVVVCVLNCSSSHANGGTEREAKKTESTNFRIQTFLPPSLSEV